MSGAVIRGEYRYLLTRDLPFEGLKRDRICWVMLNPSTADATQDDATIRKIKGFSIRWGFGLMSVVNLFALRSTDPKALKMHADPVGPENDGYIKSNCAVADLIVCAWGNHGVLRHRGVQVLEMLEDSGHGRSVYTGRSKLRAFDFTKNRQPVHPLYQRNDAELIVL